MALTAGQKLGPYQIQSAIGAGGMGEVYRALDTRLERTVLPDNKRILVARPVGDDAASPFELILDWQQQLH